MRVRKVNPRCTSRYAKSRCISHLLTNPRSRTSARLDSIYGSAAFSHHFLHKDPRPNERQTAPTIYNLNSLSHLKFPARNHVQREKQRTLKSVCRDFKDIRFRNRNLCRGSQTSVCANWILPI